MKLHKITVYLADLNNDSTLEDAKIEINDGGSDYFTKWLGKCETAEIGEWQDGHKLNNKKINIDKYWEKL